MTARFECAPASTGAQIAACFDVLSELRANIPREDWLARVARMQAQGYRLAMARDEAGIAAVAGYRIFESFARGGRSLYVDDLVTAAAQRSRGAGRALLNWLMDEARREGCSDFCLDSGVHRPDAHRFYMRERMAITAYHFTRKL